MPVAVPVLRTCVGCRARTAKSELVRLALVEGQVVFNLDGRLPGRGAHLHLKVECVSQALARKALNRAFKSEVATEVLTNWLEQSPQGAFQG